MAKQNGPVLEMTPDGRFLKPPRPSLMQILLRLATFGIALCVGAVIIWTAFIIIPVLLVLGLAGYMFVRGNRRYF